ncbi:MAG: sialidase family protein [Minicystis sp.]
MDRRFFLGGLSLLAASVIAAAPGCSSTATSSTTSSTSSTSGGSGGGGGPSFIAPPWLSDAKILVSGTASESNDCRKDICRHNENTDLINYQGAIFLVHRTAQSQILGPNSALHIYKSIDGGGSFQETALIAAPLDPVNPDNPLDTMGRDLRDPHFFIVAGKLHLKALVRLPVMSLRDSDVDTISVGASSDDGVSWTELAPIGPPTWSFWRIKESQGTFYSAAYEDGDKSVYLFSSTDGVKWAKGAKVYDLTEDTPLETELTFMPSGKLLALVRMDGNDTEILGSQGRLRTKICWSSPPYDSFDCPSTLDGQRLDGPLSFFHDNRLFVVARKHLGASAKKRTSLFEITGDFDGGALAIKEWGDLPSAGDTSYAGVATIDATHALLSWYSGDLDRDEAWTFGLFNITDIWQGTIDFDKLK